MREGIHLTVTGIMPMDEEERRLWSRMPAASRRKAQSDLSEAFKEKIKESLAQFEYDVKVKIK